MSRRVNHRRLVVAVVGGASPGTHAILMAEEVGRALVDRGFRVLTGGLGGVMEAAARGAKSSERAGDSDTLGLLPGLDVAEANPWIDIALPTGLQYARNALLVAMADGVIAVAGGAGTLSEVALAWQYGAPVVALTGLDGWSSRIAGEALDGRSSARIEPASSALEAVRLIEGKMNGASSRSGF